MFGIAITTFIQLRWRSDVLPGVFSTSTVVGEAGRFTGGAFLVLPLTSMIVQWAFTTAALITLTAALVLLPYKLNTK